MTLVSFTNEHPYRSSAGFLLIVVFVVIAIGILNERFLMGSLVQAAVVDLTLAVIGIFLLTRLDWWGKAGYTQESGWHTFPFLYCLVQLPCYRWDRVSG